ncbi:hypothetical protein CASP1_00037 [Alcaligenes phage CASP1]|nr:hypothetical protein CASP1_00037 [Alcaligenes phage CASP1]
MIYMGSKNRIAKYLLPIMLIEAKKHGITTWVEPFVGGGNIIDKVPPEFTRIGYDLNDHVVHAMIDIRDNLGLLPESISEEKYKEYKGRIPESITSWVRFVASFGAKFDAGYARRKGSDEYTFVGRGKRNAIKQSPKIQNVDFICENYINLDFENCLIYCDPPYQGTSGYKTGEFDHDLFFNWCRKQAKKNIVFVSEYSAPEDFKEVWRGEIKTNFASSRKSATHNAVEKLYAVNA